MTPGVNSYLCEELKSVEYGNVWVNTKENRYIFLTFPHLKHIKSYKAMSTVSDKLSYHKAC